MSKGNDSISKTLIVVISLCLVCSIVVAGAAVALKPTQERNKVLDKQTNILSAVGLLKEGSSPAQIREDYDKYIEAKVVDLNTGEYVTDIDIATFDQRKNSKSKDAITLTSDQDVASIKRRSNKALVYIAKDDNGQLQSYVLPVHGYGLWSTMYAFLAIEPDVNTIKALNYYEQGETPGLGAEIENPNWKASLVGKKLFDANGKQAIKVVKGKADAGSLHEVDGLSGATLTQNGVQYTFDFWTGELGFGKYLDNLRKGA